MHTLPENNDEAFALGLAFTLALAFAADPELAAPTNAGVSSTTAAVGLGLCFSSWEKGQFLR